MFLVRIYNVPEDKFQEAIRTLRETRMGAHTLSLKKLHEVFYREFMFAFK